MDSRRLALREGVFDIVLMAEFFHHLSDWQAEETMREVIRILRPEGVVLITDFIRPLSPLDFLGKLLVKLDGGRHVRAYEDSYRLFSLYFVPVKSYSGRVGPRDDIFFVGKPRPRA